MMGLNSSQCSEVTSRGAYTPTVLSCSPVTDPTSPISPQPLSPGFSSADYQLLSSIRDQTNDSPTKPNPPRKRQQYACKPGKVMKEAYFEGIAWTKTFVTGLWTRNITDTNFAVKSVKLMFPFTQKEQEKLYAITSRNHTCVNINAGDMSI